MSFGAIHKSVGLLLLVALRLLLAGVIAFATLSAPRYTVFAFGFVCVAAVVRVVGTAPGLLSLRARLSLCMTAAASVVTAAWRLSV